MRKTILMFCVVAMMAMGCHSQKQEAIATKADDEPIEMIPYEPQIWIDNFLSGEHKDTLRVNLWSEVSNQFINEIPNDTTRDMWCWYQEQVINAVLLLNDIEPLYIPNGYALAQCSNH